MIKKITVLILAAFVSFSLFAGENKLKTHTLENGIPVYLFPNDSNRIDYISISVKGGVFYLDETQSGLENTMFSLMALESENYSLEDIENWHYKTSASISGAAGSLNASLSLSCIDHYLEDSLPILLDCFMNPKFSKTQWDIAMNNHKQEMQSKMNDPASMMFYFADQMIYQNHPFNVKASPTGLSLEHFSPEALDELHKKDMNAARISVIAVTNYDEAKLLDMLNKTLGTLQADKESLKETSVPVLKELPSEPLELEHPSAGTSGHVARVVLAEPVTGDDYMAFTLASSIYDQIMFSVIRTKHGACYSPYTMSYGNQANVAFETIYRCSDFENIRDYMAEARQIMAEGKIISGTKEDGSFIFEEMAGKLESYKNTLINSTYSSQATTRGRASRILSGLYLFDDPYAMDNLAKKIRAVQAEDILRVFKKYYLDSPEFWISVKGTQEN